jgi:Xaa-Pro aminopeptidase
MVQIERLPAIRRLLPASFLMGAAVMASWTLPEMAEGQDVRERTEREWTVKLEKLETRLQPLMREHGIDMWIIMTRENAPDPLVRLFGDHRLTSSGHRNAYIFHDPGEDAPLERIILGTHIRGQLLDFFPDTPAAGHGYGEEGLAPHLERFVQERDPHTIAVNESRTITMADGLSHKAREYLLDAIGPEYSSRIVPAEPLVVDYVSHRTPAELEIALEASWITWNILRRAFSNEVVTPGTTTLMDVYWWIIRERKRQGLEFNFLPGIRIQRQGVEGSIPDYLDPVIQPGDLIHVDYGVTLMGIVTDQQKQIYVLGPEEAEPPAGLRELFAQSVRMAEIVSEELRPGVVGHQVKERAESRGQEEGIENLVYSHAQGNWVHGAGAWAIFDWPERYGIHPREPVRPTEFWSVEFSVSGPVPEWGGQRVSMGREEDGWVTEDGSFRWMAGPQSELWTIRSR